MQAIENFKKCMHQRGLYTTIKALVTNQKESLIALELSTEEKEKIEESNE